MFFQPGVPLTEQASDNVNYKPSFAADDQQLKMMGLREVNENANNNLPIIEKAESKLPPTTQSFIEKYASKPLSTESKMVEGSIDTNRIEAALKNNVPGNNVIERASVNNNATDNGNNNDDDADLYKFLGIPKPGVSNENTSQGNIDTAQKPAQDVSAVNNQGAEEKKPVVLDETIRKDIELLTTQHKQFEQSYLSIENLAVQNGFTKEEFQRAVKLVTPADIVNMAAIRYKQSFENKRPITSSNLPSPSNVRPQPNSAFGNSSPVELRI